MLSLSFTGKCLQKKAKNNVKVFGKIEHNLRILKSIFSQIHL